MYICKFSINFLNSKTYWSKYWKFSRQINFVLSLLKVLFSIFQKNSIFNRKKSPWKVKCTVRLIESTEYWYWILILQFFWHTDTDTYSVFFKLNTDTDTSVFENHTGYWILVFSFCTGQVSATLSLSSIGINTLLLSRFFSVRQKRLIEKTIHYMLDQLFLVILLT